MVGRLRNVQGYYGSARQTLAASVPRLSVSPPARGAAFRISRGELSLGDPTDVRQARADPNGTGFVLGIAGEGEIEY